MRSPMLFVLLACGVAAVAAADLPDPDALPLGAVARLGSLRFRGSAAISPDGKRLIVCDHRESECTNCRHGSCSDG
jgi:hypothetical protein